MGIWQHSISVLFTLTLTLSNGRRDQWKSAEEFMNANEQTRKSILKLFCGSINIIEIYVNGRYDMGSDFCSIFQSIDK